jgi:hypothetical protein
MCFRGETCQLNDFVGSDYSGNLDRRWSTPGYVFEIYGAMVSWRSMLQSTVTMSTTKAEYMALIRVKEALWLWGLWDNLEIKQKYVDLSCDS